MMYAGVFMLYRRFRRISESPRLLISFFFAVSLTLGILAVLELRVSAMRVGMTN
jgi:hypothetical protein